MNKDIPKKIDEINNLINYLEMYDKNLKEEFADELSLNVIDLKKHKHNEDDIKYREVNLLGNISAGSPCHTVSNILDTFYIPEDKLSSQKDYYILKVKGDSMNVLFEDGELILVECDNSFFDSDIVISLVDHEDATVKKVKFDDEYITLIPMSTNKIHIPKTYKKTDVAFQGKVVGKLSDFIPPSLNT